MILYLFILVISTFLTFVYQKLFPPTITDQVELMNRRIQLSPKLIFFVLAFLALLLPAAIRYNVGTDYMTYYGWFRDIAAGHETYFEPGLVAIVAAVSSLGLDLQWVFAIASFLTLLIVFVAVQRGSVNPAFSVFLFVAMAFYFISFNIVRQFISVAIVLYGYRYILNGKLLRYVGTIAVASFFHTTALIMLPMYFILRRRFRFVGYAITVTAMAITTLYREPLIESFLTIYPIYAGREEFLNRMIFSELFIGVGVIALVLALYLINRKRLDLKSMAHRVMFNVIFFSLSAHLLLAWVPAVNRLLYYIDILYILILPVLLSRIPSKFLRRLLTGIIVAFLLVYLYVSIYLNGSYEVLPYQTVFGHMLHARVLEGAV